MKVIQCLSTIIRSYCMFVFLFIAVVTMPACAKETESSGLPLPSTLPLKDYEKQLYRWLMTQEYKALKWRSDKSVRDTGPYVLGQYFGTHPAVRIYYSPEVVKWLEGGRKGEIADGAMIIKEMYTPPAVLYQELAKDPKYPQKPEDYENMLGKLVTAWTVMVRDSAGSKDGWFWGGTGAQTQVCEKEVDGQCTQYRLQTVSEAVESQLDDYSHPLYSGFGAMCLRCHASAENEFTFSSLKNIGGFMPDAEPIRFLVDNSWRSKSILESYPLSLLKDDEYAQSIFILPEQQRPWSDNNLNGFNDFLNTHLRATSDDSPKITAEGLTTPNPDFLAAFPTIPAMLKHQVKTFPMQWADHVVPGP